LLVNALPLALLVATLLYLDQYQNGLLVGEVGALREQARIYAGALGQSAVRTPEGRRHGDPVLVPDLARPLLRRLTEPTPFSVARLYGPDGRLIADSNPDSPDGTPPLPPVRNVGHSTLMGEVIAATGRFYDEMLSLLPAGSDDLVVERKSGDKEGLQWSPDVREQLHLGGTNDSPDMPPYIRRTRDNRLLVTVAEPVRRDGRTVGIVLLTRAAGEVDRSLDAVRRSILDLFLLALGITVLLSYYLSRTITRPILSLARAALTMREGRGRTGTVPAELRRRTDEIGELGRTLEQSARALWARMDATERFAADVSHEIKNPLSSISSAIETMRRVENPDQQRRLLAIIGEDVARLDRLISDISSASRVDAEISRAESVAIPVLPLLRALVDIHEATREPDGVRMEIDARSDGTLSALAIEDRLVQVLRNLIGNAISFSPEGTVIVLGAHRSGHSVAISVTDQGHGIPEQRLENIFDRFYSERPAGERFGQHSGLGLSISRQIVEALAGQIRAENVTGPGGEILGARFVVTLPLA
jgi:two-component system sensor histidine kinase ChvG